ncbi:MAG: methyltransferase [Enterobacteriaceae bacterium]
MGADRPGKTRAGYRRGQRSVSADARAASRRTVIVDAVELDEEAAEQARENAADSPWADRLQIHQADIQQWQPQQTRRYELIVSNPPFFAEGVPCATSQRAGSLYLTPPSITQHY